MPCYICQHQQRDEIDAAITSGQNPLVIARRFGLQVAHVVEHRRDHVKPPKKSQSEPAQPAEQTASEAPAEAKPPKPKNRAPRFQEMDTYEYYDLWTRRPSELARQLTPAEICNPDWNPLHPFAPTLPPGYSRRESDRATRVRLGEWRQIVERHNDGIRS